MGIKLAAASGGSVELVPTNTASNYTVTVPAGTGTIVVSGASSAITSGTAVASTSGTSIDFTSIPSWVKRITVMFNGVSTNGSSLYQIQIGSGSVDSTSTYVGSQTHLTGSATTTAFTTGFLTGPSTLAATNSSGIAVLAIVSSNIWAFQGSLGRAEQVLNLFQELLTVFALPQ
jgi:hypothetical protein